jgi:hypothetical protein
MDGNGNATRPYNSRAARLLARQRSHGPMIVMKMLCTKSRDGELNILRYHTLTQIELESPAFQNKRREYARKKTVHNEANAALHAASRYCLKPRLNLVYVQLSGKMVTIEAAKPDSVYVNLYLYHAIFFKLIHAVASV